MRIVYHNVRNGLDYGRIAKESITIQGNEEDYLALCKTNNNVTMFSEDGFMVREFLRWETDNRFDYVDKSKTHSSGQDFRWGIIEGETYISQFNEYIGKYDMFINRNELEWINTNKKHSQYYNMYMKIENGEIFITIDKDKKRWENLSKYGEYYDLCHKVLNNIIKTIKDMDINNDLKIRLLQMFEVKEQ